MVSVATDHSSSHRTMGACTNTRTSSGSTTATTTTIPRIPGGPATLGLDTSDPTLRLIPEEKVIPPGGKQPARVNWINISVLVATPLIALYGLWTTSFTHQTIYWALGYYVWSAFGITAGYHRLWSHRAYKAAWPYRVMMALGGAAAFEGSIKWWSKNHRAHHRFTDTDDDPYSAHKGLLWSHVGWMFFYRENRACRKVDLSDLTADPVVVWQHKHYLPLALFMAFFLPTLVAGLGWGDWRGGFFYAGVARLVFVHHATFCVNSLAHYLGDQPFDDFRTPRDHFITALVTMGEGYHNFHHEFPSDYRNAIKFYQYDPTKWFIKMSSWLGLTFDLRTFPENEIKKGVLQMKSKLIEAEKATLSWGKPIDELHHWTQSEFKTYQQSRPALLSIGGSIYDVTDFAKEHPGGEAFLKLNYGRDVTKHFNGAVYNHSTAARNLMSQFRIAILTDYVAPAFDPPSSDHEKLGKNKAE